MKRILVLSDTHIPIAANDLPQVIYDEAHKADMIIHAGDFIDISLLEKLRSLNKVVVAVYGNMDCIRIRKELKAKEIFTVGKFRIGLIHGYGAHSELMETVKSEFKDVDCVIFGHSHVATNMKHAGVLYFNPGSATDKIFASKNSYGMLEITDKKIEGRIVEL
jgi:putative phosphoesterase